MTACNSYSRRSFIRATSCAASIAAIQGFMPGLANAACSSNCPVHYKLLGFRLITRTVNFQERPEQRASLLLNVSFDSLRDRAEEDGTARIVAPDEWHGESVHSAEDRFRVGGTSTFYFTLGADDLVTWTHQTGRGVNFVRPNDISITLLGEAEWRPQTFHLLSVIERSVYLDEDDWKTTQHVRFVYGLVEFPDLMFSYRDADLQQRTYSIIQISDRVQELRRQGWRR